MTVFFPSGSIRSFGGMYSIFAFSHLALNFFLDQKSCPEFLLHVLHLAVPESICSLQTDPNED